MKINVNKYIQIAKENKITPFQLSYSYTKETTVTVFNESVEEQTIGNSYQLLAKGIVNGKLGLYSTDKIDSSTPKVVVENILESSKFGKEEKKENFFAGGKKYKKAKIYSPNFVDASLSELQKVALEISKKVKNANPKVEKVEVTLTKVESEDQMYNDLGLKAKEKERYYSLYVSVICSSDNDTQTGFDSAHSFTSLDEIKEKADEVISSAIKQGVDFINSKPIKSVKYKGVLSPKVVASLLGFYLSGLNAKSCQKHISPFEGKLNQQICSKALTIKHTPHIESTSATSFDSEGYPTSDFIIIKKGILLNYFHSLETARNESVEPNGCGAGLGEAIGQVASLMPSKKSEDELFSKVKKGIYITNVKGLNAGIDKQTLNFSLPCEGYEIIDGKVSKATSMIICSGNLKDLFSDVIAVSNNTKNLSSIITPSLLVKKITISGN